MSSAQQVIRRYTRGREERPGGGLANGVQTLGAFFAHSIATGRRALRADVEHALRNARELRISVYARIAERGIDPDPVEAASINALVNAVAIEAAENQRELDEDTPHVIVDALLSTGVCGETLVNSEMLLGSLEVAFDVHLAAGMMAPLLQRTETADLKMLVIDGIALAHSHVEAAIEQLAHPDSESDTEAGRNELRYALRLAAAELYPAALKTALSNGDAAQAGPEFSAAFEALVEAVIVGANEPQGAGGSDG